MIGKVLDDRSVEDQDIIQLLAASSSLVSIRWQQGKFVGGGTFGNVYVAINLESGQLMAVKEIRLQDSVAVKSLTKSIRDEM